MIFQVLFQGTEPSKDSPGFGKSIEVIHTGDQILKHWPIIAVPYIACIVQVESVQPSSDFNQHQKFNILLKQGSSDKTFLNFRVAS
jgi:hypothetical protein